MYWLILWLLIALVLVLLFGRFAKIQDDKYYKIMRERRNDL